MCVCVCVCVCVCAFMHVCMQACVCMCDIFLYFCDNTGKCVILIFLIFTVFMILY